MAVDRWPVGADVAVLHDRHVRAALKQKVLVKHQSEPDTLVLDELGLRHGACRVDVAVVNGSIHGYEIKSDADTLERFPSQVTFYGAVLDKATLVVSDRHLAKAERLVPFWWGLLVTSTGPRGAVHFEVNRSTRLNPDIQPRAVAELLWHSEAADALRSKGLPAKELRKPRSELYALITETYDLAELRAYVRQTLKRRERWRGQRPHEQSAGSTIPIPK